MLEIDTCMLATLRRSWLKKHQLFSSLPSPAYCVMVVSLFINLKWQAILKSTGILPAKTKYFWLITWTMQQRKNQLGQSIQDKSAQSSSLKSTNPSSLVWFTWILEEWSITWRLNHLLPRKLYDLYFIL